MPLTPYQKIVLEILCLIAHKVCFGFNVNLKNTEMKLEEARKLIEE